MFIILLHHEDLSGSLDPEKSNAEELEVRGPFETMDDAIDWLHEKDENGKFYPDRDRWLTQVHKVTSPSV